MSLTAFQLRFCPGLYLHQEHIPHDLMGLLDGLPNWREDSRINGYLLANLALDCDYEQPKGLGGIGLLGESDFEKLLSMLGAMLHAKAIRATLDASVQGQLRDVIGEQGVRICLSQVDVIIGVWPSDWQRQLPSSDIANHLLHTGLGFWVQAMDTVNDDFSKRLLLRLPKNKTAIQVDLEPDTQTLAQALCLKITKLVTPECLHLLN